MVCPANISSPVGSCHIFLKRYGDASTNTQLSSAHLPQTLGLVNNLLTALINYVTHTHRLDAIKGEVVDCSCLCCMTRSVEQQLCGGREVAGAHPYSLKPHTWKPSSHPCLTGPGGAGTGSITSVTCVLLIATVSRLGCVLQLAEFAIITTTQSLVKVLIIFFQLLETFTS